jgi:hypothetical protein
VIRRSISIMMFAWVGLACAPLASAQLPPGPDTGAGSDSAAPSDQAVSRFSDDELRSFAAAALAVQQVKDTYAPILASAATSEDQQRVIEAADEEMKRAVRDNGLSVERFQEILDSASTDPVVIDRINQHLNGR